MDTTQQHSESARWFFVIAGVIVFVLFWKVIEPFALVLVTAGIAAIIVAPIQNRLCKLLKYEKLTALLIVLGVLVVIIVPLFISAILMVEQASEIIESSFSDSGWLRNVSIEGNAFFERLPPVVQDEVLSLDLRAIATGAAQWIFEHIGELFASTARLIFNIFIFFVALYYFLVDRKRIYGLVLELSPLRDKIDAKIVDRIVRTVRGVVFGALIVAIVQGILAAVGMTIFGVPGALIWGALVVIASQVPILGVGIIMIPAVLFLYFTGSPVAAIGLLIWSALVVGMADNLLKPILIEGRTKMHALLILISILGGLQMFGSIGFIVGPTILAAVMVVVELYKGGILERGR